MTRASLIVPQNNARMELSLAPVGFQLWWAMRRGRKALDAKIKSLRQNRKSTRRSRVVTTAVALADVNGVRPDKKNVRAALSMIGGKYVLADTPDIRLNAIVIAACAVALHRQKVHIVLLSEAQSGAILRYLRPLAEKLIISLAVIEDQTELDARTLGYNADIVLAPANRLTRDLLRDRILHGGRSRGTRAAVSRLGARGADDQPLWPHGVTAFVSDADLLFFEPPRPVAVADELERELGRQLADQAFLLISALQHGTHYTIEETTRRIRLTDDGRAKVETYATLFGTAWRDPAWCETTVLAAITVRDLYEQGGDYSVEDGDIKLARAAGRVVNAPSIPDLIAAKEAMPIGRGELHLADTRRLMASYASLGACGAWVPGLDAELKACFSVKRAGQKSIPDSRAKLHMFEDSDSAKAEVRRRLSSVQSTTTTLWAPFGLAVQDLAMGVEFVTGLDIFATPLTGGNLIQFGAAPANWEVRLNDLAPGMKVERFVTAHDPYFAILAPDSVERTALLKTPTAETYVAAQNEEARLRHEKRLMALKSDDFFDRILAFTGEAQW